MKKILFIVGCLLVLGSSPVLAQEKSDIVVVRVHESLKGAHLVIERGTSQPQVVDFEAGDSNSDNMSAAKGYYEVVSKLYQQGYVLQSTIMGPNVQRGPAATANYSNSTLIFVKSAPKP